MKAKFPGMRNQESKLYKVIGQPVHIYYITPNASITSHKNQIKKKNRNSVSCLL